MTLYFSNTTKNTYAEGINDQAPMESSAPSSNTTDPTMQSYHFSAAIQSLPDYHPSSEFSSSSLALPPQPSRLPSDHIQSQHLYQQHQLSPSILPLHSMSLDQLTYPLQALTAESVHQTSFTHPNSIPNESISTTHEYLVSSTLDREDIPQGWLWDSYQQAAIDPMRLDRISQLDQRLLSQSPQMGAMSEMASHSAAASNFHVHDTFWNSNALEIASRAATLAAAPLENYGFTTPTPTLTDGTPYSLTAGLSASVPSTLSPRLSNSSTPGLLRPSRSDGVGRKNRRSSSKAASSLVSGGRSGRSRSLVSSPRSPFHPDPNEAFNLELSKAIPSYPQPTLQSHYSLHYNLATSGHGHSHGQFSPSLSHSTTSTPPSPSISPQLSPMTSFAHPTPLPPTVVSTKPESSSSPAAQPGSAFVRLPPPMFQCPMEKCPKSFARAYNLHIHLKTQHHLASKELAAVSPLRAPPSAPPFQIITPEEVAAGLVIPDSDVTKTPRSRAATAAASSSSAKASSANEIENGTNAERAKGNSSGADHGENASLGCDDSCMSPTLGNTQATGQGKSFSCHMCPRIFSRKHDLHRHIRVHTGSKPYVCTNCNKAFARTDALCRHYKVEDECRQVLTELETLSTSAMAGDDGNQVYTLHPS
ncbi:hypothetical protein FBU30_007715 [Linnemannia zychae]|nr:hypothetical protein FBU30_007715 [Linnemannia zychae]